MDTARLFGLWFLQLLLLAAAVGAARLLPGVWAWLLPAVFMLVVATIIIWQLMGLKQLAGSGQWLFGSSVLALIFLVTFSLFDLCFR